MKFTNFAYTGSLLIVVLGLAVTPHSHASLLFNGTNSKATLDGSFLGATNTLFYSNYTFEVWIKPFSAGGGELFGKMNYWDEWDLTVPPDGGLIFGGAWDYAYWGTETAVGSITTNVWQHVCCAVTNGLASFYVNGNLVGTEAVQNPIDFYASTNTGAMAPYGFDGRMPIGYADSGTTPDYNFFNGLIYGIKVWSRTLSASEVRAIATTGVPLSTNGLYNAVMLNEGSGTTIHDSLTSLTGRVLTAQWSLDAPTFPSSFLTNGLIAYYPFNGNANDASGNGINGTVYGATLTTDRFGNPNAAYLFGGTSYIAVPLNSALFGTDFTASVWFNASDINNSWPTLLEEVGNTAFTLGIVGQTSGAYPQNIGDLYAFATHAQATKDWELNPLPLFQPSLNQYYQVVVVRAGTNVMMYWNGTLGATNQVVNPTVEPGNTFYIGCAGDSLNSDWVFHGVIDDVRIYSRALSASEVQQLYAYESTPQPTATPPSITSQPQSVTVNAHANASFSVTASGTMPLSYQWSFNGTNMSGATASSLTISNVTPQALGAYAVLVSNSVGSVTSSNAVLSMYPFIAAPFLGLVTDWGYTNTLSVGAWGTGPLSYQWFDNGVAVLNATNQTLTLTSIQFTNAGLYSVVVSSPLGSVTNTPEQVVVNPAGVSLGMYPGVTVTGTVGYTYAIQATTDLSSTNSWTTVATLTLMQPTQLWVDISVNAFANPHRFYRVMPGD